MRDSNNGDSSETVTAREKARKGNVYAVTTPHSKLK